MPGGYYFQTPGIRHTLFSSKANAETERTFKDWLLPCVLPDLTSVPCGLLPKFERQLCPVVRLTGTRSLKSFRQLPTVHRIGLKGVNLHTGSLLSGSVNLSGLLFHCFSLYTVCCGPRSGCSLYPFILRLYHQPECPSPGFFLPCSTQSFMADLRCPFLQETFPDSHCP